MSFFFWVCVRDLTMATTKGIEGSYNVGPHLFVCVCVFFFFLSVVSKSRLEIRGGFVKSGDWRNKVSELSWWARSR